MSTMAFVVNNSLESHRNDVDRTASDSSGALEWDSKSLIKMFLALQPGQTVASLTEGGPPMRMVGLSPLGQVIIIVVTVPQLFFIMQ